MKKLTITAMALAIALPTVGNAADNNPSAFGSPTPHRSTRVLKVYDQTEQLKALREFYVGHFTGYREGILNGGLGKVIGWEEDHASPEAYHSMSLDPRDVSNARMKQVKEGAKTTDISKRAFAKGYIEGHSRGILFISCKLIDQLWQEVKTDLESGADHHPVSELMKMSDEERAVKYGFTEKEIRVYVEQYMNSVYAAMTASPQSRETFTSSKCE